MTTRRANPNKVKLHRSYSIAELASCLGIHKNTIRNWQSDGLEPTDDVRPTLFHGGAVRQFLRERNKARKQPCPAGTIFCMRCREPRAPALGMVEYVPITRSSGNLRALCETCECLMHRRTRESDIYRVMPNIEIQTSHAPSSISEKATPSDNCDLRKES